MSAEGRDGRRTAGHPKRADVRDEDILRLRKEGLSWQAIALETGMSRTGVRLRHGALTGRARPDRPKREETAVTARPPAYDRHAPVGVAEVADRAGPEAAAALAADPEMATSARWTVNGSPAWPWRDVLRWGVRTGVIQPGLFPHPADHDAAALERPGYTGARERLGDLPGWLLRGTAADRESGCLVYVAGTDEDGYGRSPKKRLVHREAWKLLVGPIPEDITLDHRHDLGCQSSACWAPWHLEPVTAAENLRRQRSRRR